LSSRRKSNPGASLPKSPDTAPLFSKNPVSPAAKWTRLVHARAYTPGALLKFSSRFCFPRSRFMSTLLALPPGARDFQIYQRVTLEAATTRQAAAEFSISQTRVRQIVQRVSCWLAESMPARTDESDAARLNLAQHLAADRLQYLYGQAMHGWRTTSQSKYAGVLLRCIAAQGKMPVTPGALDALIADAIEGPLPDEPSTLARSASEGNVPSTLQSVGASNDGPDSQSSVSPPPSAVAPPSLGDCSTHAPSPRLRPEPSADQISLTATAANESDNPSDSRTAARRAFFAPAHALDAAGLSPATMADVRQSQTPVTAIEVNPQQLGVRVQTQLSRRERRRLRHAAKNK
jgi:hypothetical protein